MALCVLLLILTALPMTTGQKELVFLISGSDELGGHVAKAFQFPILHAIRLLTSQFELTRFGAVWGSPVPENNSWEVISHLTNERSYFLDIVELFVKAAPRTPMSINSGIGGAVEYTLEHLFSKNNLTQQILVVLTHKDVIADEFQRFFEKKCHRLTIYTIIYPWPYEKCTNKKVQKMIAAFNLRLNWTAHVPGPLAVCGMNQTALQNAEIQISKAEHVAARVMHFCRFRSEDFIRKMKLHQREMDALFGLPCEDKYKELSLVKCPSDTDGCSGWFCHTANILLLVGLGGAAVFLLAVLIIIASLVQSYLTKKRRSATIRHVWGQQENWFRTHASDLVRMGADVNVEMEVQFKGRRNLNRRRATLAARRTTSVI